MATEELKDTEEIETLQSVKKQIKEEEEEEEEEEIFGDISSFKNVIDSREFRHCFVSIILLVWSGLMIPYDINGSIIHGGYVSDRDMFISSLYIWLICHLSVIISSILSFITLLIGNNIESEWIINIELLLIMTSSCLQILGSILFAYSYCVNTTDSDSNYLWASCVCKCHGLYLLYNSGFITYFGFIIFATKYNGSIPLISLIIDKNCCIDRNHIDDDNPIQFNKNFRVSYLSIVSFIGMILILVFGFEIYGNLGDSYQAIYIGYTFMLIATFIVIISQLIFHCNLFKKYCCYYCNKRRKKKRRNIIENTATTTIHTRNIKNNNDKKSKENIEKIIHLAVYFLIYAGIVMIFMYSLVSKIPEAANIVERLRLIGNMIIITGTGIVITYELFTNDDNYNDNKQQNINHQYNIIPNHDYQY